MLALLGGHHILHVSRIRVNDPEECSSQLLKLILRINTNTWLYNL
jgi:hypothetical protein